MNKYAETIRIVRSIRKQTDTAVLFYSAGGKDSIALLDMLAREFDKVVCYFLYLVEGMEHQELYNHWALKKYKNIEIRRIPHIQVAVLKKNGFFCEPEDVETEKMGELEQRVMAECGASFAFSGMKGVDGFMKRMRLKMWGENYTSPKGMVYPLAVWTNKEVLAYIRKFNLITPFSYSNPKAVSQGCGLDADTLVHLKEKYPNDYNKILKEYPFAGIIIHNHEKQNQASGDNASIEKPNTISEL